jgi:hypothetical protein
MFYRDISEYDKISPISFILIQLKFYFYFSFQLYRETLPFRASIRDFDLDPPLTYKGLKDSYHTGE